MESKRTCNVTQVRLSCKPAPGAAGHGRPRGRGREAVGGLHQRRTTACLPFPGSGLHRGRGRPPVREARADSGSWNRQERKRGPARGSSSGRRRRRGDDAARPLRPRSTWSGHLIDSPGRAARFTYGSLQPLLPPSAPHMRDVGARAGEGRCRASCAGDGFADGRYRERGGALLED
jgi:hypothetical protein